MINQISKNKVCKAKHTSSITRASNKRKKSLKPEVGCKIRSRQRGEVDSQPLLKYVLIGSGFVVLTAWFCFTNVYFMNSPTLLQETSDTLRVGQQEAAHEFKKEPASSDVEQKHARSKKECVISGKRLGEIDALTRTEVISAKKKVQDVVKISELDSTAIMVPKMQTFVRKDKNTISILEKTTQEQNNTNLKREACFIWESETQKEKLKSENIGNFQRKTMVENEINIPMIKIEKKNLHRQLKRKLRKNENQISDDKHFLAADKTKHKIKTEKLKNKNSSGGNNLRWPSEKNEFNKVSLVSEPITGINLQQLASNRDGGNVLKNRKANKAIISHDATAGGKEKNTQKNTNEMKNNKIESHLQTDYLSSEMKNFQSSIQNMFVPKQILVNRREISPIELIAQKHNNSSVRVFIFERFLSDDECDNLRRVHDKHIKLMSNEDPLLCFDSVKTLHLHLKSAGRGHINVSHLDFTKDTTCVNKTFSSQLKKWLKAKWSYSTAFYPGETKFSELYEQRVKQATGLNPENGGKFQITSYPKGIGYKKHTDCIENSSERRDRMTTMLVYLDTVKKGGETRFPELGISVRPRKGRALVWNNMDQDGNCEPTSAHVADSVINGHKYILQRWYYYQSFYSLGKRPPQTEKPKRSIDQARVSCDEYAHGSCRWYDEWNHDHLIQYHQKNVIKI